MRKITLLLLITITFSCKQENEPYSMYGLLIEEFIQSKEILKTQIAENLSSEKLINDEVAKSFDSLTSEYLNYLETTHLELTSKVENPKNYDSNLFKKNLVNDFFFDGEEYNQKGTEFISKLETYRADILELISNENLANRTRSILDTRYVQNREGKKIEHLNYFYKDMPLISVLAHMKNREKSILELENDFLKNRMLNE